MTNAEKLIAIAAFTAALEEQDAKRSTASHAKYADFSVRDYIMVHGVDEADDVRCRAAEKFDWTIRVNGKYYHGENKVGCGALRYGKTAADVAIDLDKIYPGVSYFSYCAEPAKLKAHKENAPKLFRVFTREQFFEVLTVTGRKGLESSLRIHQTKSGTWQLEIQPWQTKQTAARLGKYEEYCKANNIPTLEEFRAMVRG